MRTFYNSATGRRIPGGSSGNLVACPTGNGRQLDIFERDKGWRKEPITRWLSEEIPDLVLDAASNFPEDEYAAYATKWGNDCAIAQLKVADVCKTTYHNVYMLAVRVPKEKREQFLHFFGYPFHRFLDYRMAAFGAFSPDVVSMDKRLKEEHGYTEEKHGSMADFVRQKFGDEALALVEGFLKPLPEAGVAA